MTTSTRGRLLRRVWRNRSLRRLCLAMAAFRLAELAVWIALIAYAYTAGGVGEASVVTVLELVPATVFALAVGGFIRRHGAHQVLRWGLAVQAGGMFGAAVLLRQGIDVPAYAAAIVAATAITTTRPARSVLTPGMVEEADDLTATNVVSGAREAGAGLAGPASAAILMTTVGSWAVFAVMAAVVGAAAAAVWRIPSTFRAADDDPESLLAGLRATAREPGPRIVVLGVAAYYVVIGAVDVLAVVITVELLHKSEAYSGYVTTAVGIGCFCAGSLSLAMIGRRWISPWILTSTVVIGIALVGVSVSGSRIVASVIALFLFGVASTTYELTSLLLLQRVSRLDLLGHIFALVEALQMAMLAVGAAVVPLAVQLFGSHAAPAAVGVLFLVLVGALAARIVGIDRHARVPITEMATLRATPLFGALPGPALETIARETRRTEAAAGTIVVRQGDPGSEFFTVVSGCLVVSVDGADVGELGRGDGFGEIALIRDVPRTATVRATTDAVLLSVDREPFLTAVTGHAATHDRASSIAAGHMDSR